MNNATAHELKLLMIDQVITKSDDIAHDHQLAMAIARSNDEHELYSRASNLYEMLGLYLGMIRITRPALTTDLDHTSTNWRTIHELVERCLKLKDESLAVVTEAGKILDRLNAP